MDGIQAAGSAQRSVDQRLNDLTALVRDVHERQTAMEHQLLRIEAVSGMNATEDLSHRLRALGVIDVPLAWGTRGEIEKSNKEVAETIAYVQRELQKATTALQRLREGRVNWKGPNQQQEAEMKAWMEQMERHEKDCEKTIADAEEVAEGGKKVAEKTAEKRTTVWQKRLDLAEMKRLMKMMTTLELDVFKAEIEDEMQSMTKEEIRGIAQESTEALMKKDRSGDTNNGEEVKVKDEKDERDENPEDVEEEVEMSMEKLTAYGGKGKEKGERAKEELEELMEKLKTNEEKEKDDKDEKGKEASKERTEPPPLSPSSSPGYMPLARPPSSRSAPRQTPGRGYFGRRGPDSYNELTEGKRISDGPGK